MLLLFNKSESLERAKVVVFKLGAVLFIAESILNLYNYEKKNEDLNRNVPHKINEFTTLALAGRYP